MMQPPPDVTRSTERRWKRLEVDPDFLVEMCRNTEWIRVRVIRNALPDDARLIAAMCDPFRPVIHLTIESASYPPVGDGAVPPVMEPPSWARWYGPGEPPAEDAVMQA